MIIPAGRNLVPNCSVPQSRWGSTLCASVCQSWWMSLTCLLCGAALEKRQKILDDALGGLQHEREHIDEVVQEVKKV